MKKIKLRFVFGTLNLKKIWLLKAFAAMTVISAYCLPLASQSPTSNATFHCISLYWKPADAASDNECTLKYRELGKSAWTAGYSLWFDPNDHVGQESHSKEYRGSMVNLKPGTNYEIELKLIKTGTTVSLTQTTMSETFKIRYTVLLDSGFFDQPKKILNGGSRFDGYVLYDGQGLDHEIDVQQLQDYCVRIDANYVIIRGLKLKGGKKCGIMLGNVHHVVIEDCDISGWGTIVDSGTLKDFGINLQSAVFSESSVTVSNIIIQRNKLHHPATDCNSWSEPVNPTHPEGPQGISFRNTDGYNIIRYNEIYSDKDHMFNDGMGNFGNFSFAGFPNRDSDIYGNKISHCWDDAIEAEGSGMNVRIWSNYSDSIFTSYAVATVSLGPQYALRNVSNFSQLAPYPFTKYNRGGLLFKLGAEPESAQYAKGRIMIFHNTALQPLTPWSTGTATAGAESGIIHTSSVKIQENVLSRNNILHVRSGSTSVNDYSRSPTNSYDYDFYSGGVSAANSPEIHGIKGVPKYDTYNKIGEYYLSPNSSGHDQALLLPGFNHEYIGKGPDMGAFEIGLPSLQFGLKADWNKWIDAINSYPTSVKPDNSLSDEMRKSLFVALPNPVDDILSIRLLNEINNGFFTIYNSAGSIFYTETINGFREEPKTVDVSSWPAGVYIITLRSEKETGRERIIVY